MLNEPRTVKLAATLLTVFAAVNLATGCGDGDSSSSTKKLPPGDDTPTVTTLFEPENDLAPVDDHQPSFEPDYNNLTPQPWVEPVTTAQQDGVDVFPDRLVFSDTMSEVGDWEPGRLVVSGPGLGTGKNPMGFARRVVKVEHVGAQYVVTTTVAAIEDVLQGDVQLQLKPEQMQEMDLTKADLQWVADSLYFQAPEADWMQGDLLIDDYPEGQDPLSFWKKLKKGVKKATQAVGGAAKAVAKGAVQAYQKVTPSSFSGSVKLSPTLSVGSAMPLFTMEYTKGFKTKGGVPFELFISGSGDYDASVSMKPGVQVGAKIAVPGHNTKSAYWVNIDAAMAMKFKANIALEAGLQSAGGESGSALEEKLAEGSGFASEMLSYEREKLFGDPDVRPQGGWKKTLWISKPATQVLAAGPVPVVMVETAQIDLECGFQAKASINVALDLQQNSTFKYSVRSDQPTAAPKFSKTKKVDVQVTGGGEVSVNCGLIPRVNVFFYDTVGLFAGVRGSLVAKAAYESKCKSDPKDYHPTGEMTLGLYGNVGVRAGVRVQVPGSSFAGKAGQSLGVETDIEPWNTEFPLLEKKWSFPKGFGYCTPTCKNLAKDGSETDADCGGQCGTCSVGKHCKLNSDCAASVCVKGVCSTNYCGDGVQDGQETDVDCGGPKCGPCAVGDGCSAGSDCASTFCSAWTVDEPPICVVSHCESGVKDGDEGGVDCGGSTCPKCATGAEADGAADCESGAHNGAICVASTCFDMALSSGETAVDCGGSTCAQRCGFQQACKQNGDCAQGLACHPTQNVCLRDLEQACTAGADCVTDNCQSGVCAAIDTTCSNGAQDGAETDVDCGGPACDKCGVLEHCMLNSDCVFDHCVLLSGSSGGHCMAPSNLISAWPFDGSGKDVSGNGNSALLMGNSSYTTQAHSGGQAASFAATSSWAVTSSIDVGNELTLTGWLYLPSPGPGGSMPIITSAQSFSTPNGFDFMVNPPQSTLALGFDSGDGSTGCTVTSADNVLALDTWQHVAVAVNRTAGTAILYVNGAAVAGTGCVSTAFPTNQSLVLGGWVNYDGPGTGQLDDVRIYGSVLTATEIAAIAQQ